MIFVDSAPPPQRTGPARTVSGGLCTVLDDCRGSRQRGVDRSNPCRKLRISFDDQPERPHAATDEVDALAGRMSPDNGLMVVTDAYTGLRWGEIAGSQWIRTYLDADPPHIDIDPKFGALHEVRGRLELGPPKIPRPVSARCTCRRSWPTSCGRTGSATRMPGSCSPGRAAGCTDGPTSGGDAGCPRWPGTRRRGGHR